MKKKTAWAQVSGRGPPRPVVIRTPVRRGGQNGGSASGDGGGALDWSKENEGVIAGSSVPPTRSSSHFIPHSLTASGCEIRMNARPSIHIARRRAVPIESSSSWSHVRECPWPMQARPCHALPRPCLLHAPRAFSSRIPRLEKAQLLLHPFYRRRLLRSRSFIHSVLVKILLQCTLSPSLPFCLGVQSSVDDGCEVQEEINGGSVAMELSERAGQTG